MKIAFLLGVDNLRWSVSIREVLKARAREVKRQKTQDKSRCYQGPTCIPSISCLMKDLILVYNYDSHEYS